MERVDSGEAALAAAANPYDLLILDRLTAGLDGLETLKRVRAGGGPSASGLDPELLNEPLPALSQVRRTRAMKATAWVWPSCRRSSSATALS